MNKKIYIPIVNLLYILSAFILIYCIRVRVNPNVYLETDARLIVLFTVCLFIYIAGYLLVEKLNYNKRILKINLIIYFLIYTVTIFTLTLFDEIYGRQGFAVIKWNKELLNYYLKNSFNIIPFNTINLFIDGYHKGIIGLKSFTLNITGNLLAFMPYAIFLPLIFKSMKKYKNFLITMILIVIGIELLQFLTMSGSCDIDDLILNVLGASIIYFITKIKCINRFIYKIFLYE